MSLSRLVTKGTILIHADESNTNSFGIANTWWRHRWWGAQTCKLYNWEKSGRVLPTCFKSSKLVSYREKASSWGRSKYLFAHQYNNGNIIDTDVSFVRMMRMARSCPKFPPEYKGFRSFRIRDRIRCGNFDRHLDRTRSIWSITQSGPTKTEWCGTRIFHTVDPILSSTRWKLTRSRALICFVLSFWFIRNNLLLTHCNPRTLRFSLLNTHRSWDWEDQRSANILFQELQWNVSLLLLLISQNTLCSSPQTYPARMIRTTSLIREYFSLRMKLLPPKSAMYLNIP